MAIGKNLLKEKTNVGVKGTVTFNAPGNYKAPYGKTTVTLGGRGATGNPGNPGNPTVPGNYVPGNYNPGAPHSTRSIYNQYSPGSQGPRSSGGDGPFGGAFSPRSHFTTYTYWGQSLHQSVTYTVDYSVGASTNPGHTNPTSPGNPGNAGNPGSNATIEGVYFPGGAGGNAGPASSPGGAGSTAPTVSPTTVAVQYTTAGISVTVPSGGYLDFTNT